MKRCYNKACRAELDPDQDTTEEPLCEACQAEAEGEHEMYEDYIRGVQGD